MAARGFWSVFNNIPKASQLQARYSYHLMRDIRRPLWEDDCNRHGGYWRMKCSKQDTETVWQELLLAAIGEQLSDCMADGDEIGGLSVSSRDRDTLIQIWNTNSQLHEKSTILQKVKEILSGVQFFTVFYTAFEKHSAFEGGDKSYRS